MSEATPLTPEGIVSDEAALAFLRTKREPVEAQADEGPDEDSPEEAAADTVEAEDADEGQPEEAEAAESTPDDESQAEDDAEGKLRWADYTRKSQELAEIRRKTEAEAAAIAAERQRLATLLQEYAVTPQQEPDWEALAQTYDAKDILMAKARWDKDQTKRQKAREEFTALQKREREATAAAEWDKLTSAVPEWRDPERFRADFTSLVQAASQYGITRDELDANLDHRVFLALKDAAAYRALQAKKTTVEKKVAAAPPALKPGAKPSKPSVQVEAEKALARLRKTGSDDAAMAFLRARRHAS